MPMMPGIPLDPSIKIVCAFGDRSSKGLCRGIRNFVASPVSAFAIYVEPPPGPSPPSSSGRDGSTMTFDGSKLHRLPSPLHVSHAPNGLLNENDRGSSCGTLAPQSGHANFCEYSFSRLEFG